MRLLCIINIAISMLLLAGCDSSIFEENPTYEQSSLVEVGDKAPLFSATLLDGTAVSLADYRGEYMMLILFSHTCPDCKTLLDDLHSGDLFADHLTWSGDMAMTVLAVGRDATTTQLQEYCSKNGYTVDMIADNNRAIFNLYATTYVPRVYIIDPQGVIEKMYIESYPKKQE
ncbi:MAG: TlpA family protein disulfide reductase [Alistipes sp.]|nr:TlpA family protein disulfide reductase [Alistipes sp.]